MRLYIQAGVIAEGPTDLRFLTPLIDRSLPEVCSAVSPGNFEIAPTIALGRGEARDPQTTAQIVARELDRVLLFVFHADAAGDLERAMTEVIAAKLEAARTLCGERDVLTAACVPVRETEAWMIADPDVFMQLGLRLEIELPRDPEAELDPKATLRRALGTHAGRKHVYELFGENVQLSRLRELSSFRRFESALRAAADRLRIQQGIR